MGLLTDIIVLGENPLKALILILRYGGFVVLYPVLVWMLLSGWIQWIQNKYRAKKKYVLLAIDIPRLNEQTMKAIDQVMVALHGVHFGPNNKEKYWIGAVQDKFSLEIVSIDGYIQYFVQCDHYNADLVKGAFFAQYPDAEIIEVEDYIYTVPHQYPDEKYDCWGTHFILAKPEVYPVKTYEHFEHQLTGLYADPMAAVLELMSRLRPGEQVWLQLVITPEGFDWREKGLREVDKLIGKKVKTSRGVADIISDFPLRALEGVNNAIFSNPEGFGGVPPPRQQENPDGKFLSMTTGEKIIVEEIQKKIARINFQTKFRFLYFAPKDVMNTYRVVGSIFGAIKQFNSLDLNAFKAGGSLVTSGPTYYFVKRRRNARKRTLILGYKHRSNSSGPESYALSTVELSTVFHFPTENVRAPMVSKTEAKKAEPPSRLPLERSPFETLRVGYEKVVVQPENVQVPGAPAAGQEVPTEAVQEQYYQPLPPAPPAHSDVASSQEPLGSGYSLHSMPGLPPGVMPVQQQPSAQQPQTQHSYGPKIASVTPGPHQAPQSKAQAPQSKAQAPQSKAQAPQSKAQAPSNLPFA